MKKFCNFCNKEYELNGTKNEWANHRINCKFNPNRQNRINKIKKSLTLEKPNCLTCGKKLKRTGYKYCPDCSKIYRKNISLRNNKGEIRNKINQGTKRYYSLKINKINHARKVGNGTKMKYKPLISSILDLNTRTRNKLFDRMLFDKMLKCSYCFWDKSRCDLHHIDKNRKNNSHENICYLCPNCHRLVHRNLIKKEELINLKEFIGDRWKKYYFG